MYTVSYPEHKYTFLPLQHLRTVLLRSGNIDIDAVLPKKVDDKRKVLQSIRHAMRSHRGHYLVPSEVKAQHCAHNTAAPTS